ncbi:MAG: M3 family oligoendopeptidase [Phycisphaerales bacterium]
MTTMTVAQRRFVPTDLDPSDWVQLEPIYKSLLDRPTDSLEQLKQWLADFSELSAAVYEYGSRKNIDSACHTDDPEIEKAFLHYIENIAPKIQPIYFELQKKLLASPAHTGLDAKRFGVMIRDWRASVELFRPENVPLQTEIAKLNNEYDKAIGAMTVEFDGKTLTLQQLSRYLEEPNRETREKAWRLSSDRRLEERARFDEIFDKMLVLRKQIADNAGMPDYRAYMWKAKDRFDYTPEHCHQFADAIEKVCLPVIDKMDAQRKASLGLDTLRPWDLGVDVKGRAPLNPFDRDTPQELVDKSAEVFRRVDPGLGKDFSTLKMGRNLDLESRKGKRAGGFQASLQESREPFIFMNAAGLDNDVRIMLHEAGHAFHFMWAAAEEPLVFMRHTTEEFCEVASMSMELIGADHYDVFYPDAADRARAWRSLLEGIITILPWIATIDQFQHWIYTNPGHMVGQRTTAWLGILDRFQRANVDWSGLDDARAAMWQKQLHLYHVPFYYIEYGIAQLGALQLWLAYRNDPVKALASYRSALRLGGKRPLPELFETAGLKFDFSRATLEPLMAAIGEELDRLPV